MKNNTTELVFILDRSGSMSGLEKDTIGGFNSLIEKQKKDKGKCYVSTVLFNESSTVLYDRVNLDEIKPMTEDDYLPMGCTALIDAMGSAIHHIANIHKYARKEDVPEHTLFVIITDGLENASHIYSADRVRETVKKEKEKYGWEFLFVGANIDSVETAKNYGIDANRAVDYRADEEGTEVLYGALADSICAFRMDTTISDDWSDEIKKDYEGRN